MRGNPAAYAMLRLPSGANLSKTGPEGEMPPFRVYHHGQEARGEDLPMQRAARTGLAAHGVECDIVWDDGTTCHWYGGATPLFDEQGAVRGSVGAFIDITERKRAEQALRVSEANYRRAREAQAESEAKLTLGMQVAGLALAEVDYATGLTHLSAAAARMFGLGDVDVVVPRATVHATFHPEDRPKMMPLIAASLDPAGPGWFAMDHRVIWPNGEVRWLRVRKQVFFTGEGEQRRPVRAVLAAYDVTTEKNAIEALRESTLRYQHLLNFSPIAIFSCAPTEDFRITFVSENVQAILGYPPDGFVAPAVWPGRIHPEDRERLVAALPQLFARGTHAHDCRFRLQDGGYRWLHMELILVREMNEAPLEIIGSLQDISERKEAEEKLRLALEAGQAGTFLHDLNTNTVEWSADLQRIVGYEPGTFGGTYADVQRHVHPDDRDELFTTINDAIATCSEYQFEFRLVRLDGTIVWTAGCGRAYARNGTKADTITGVAFDVTERKRQQQQIADLNTRLQRAVAESHHRIKNNLQVLYAMVDMQNPYNVETVPAEELRRIGQHIQTLAMLHDILTLDTKVAAGRDFLSLKVALEKIAPMLQIAAGGRRITLHVDEVMISLKQGGAFTLLVNELVSNALKHGSGDVEVTLTQLPQPDAEPGSMIARLEVSDDGPGFPSGFDAKSAANTGLELIESLGRWDLRGEIVYTNRPQGGARVIVTFPLHTSAQPTG